MGDAFTAVCDDKDAYFYNPAGLNQMDKGYFDLIRLNVDTNESTADSANRFNKLGASRSASDMVQLVKDLIDTDISMGLSTGISFVRKNFGLGLLAEAQITGGLNLADPITSAMDAVGHLNGVIIHGLSKHLKGFKKDIVAGYTLKFVKKKTFTGQAGVANPSGTVAQDLDTEGVSLDLGMLYKLRGYGEPTLGVAVTDLLTAGFEDKLAKALEPDINLGIAVRPLPKLTSRMVGTTFSAEIRNLLLDDSFSRKLCLGGELTLGKAIKVRAGYYQGYPTYGVGLRLPLINMDVASYARHVPGRAIGDEDRHYILSMKLIF
jgi:hypothetical protein